MRTIGMCVYLIAIMFSSQMTNAIIYNPNIEDGGIRSFIIGIMTGILIFMCYESGTRKDKHGLFNGF